MATEPKTATDIDAIKVAQEPLLVDVSSPKDKKSETKTGKQ